MYHRVCECIYSAPGTFELWKNSKFDTGKHAQTWWMTVTHRQGVQSGPFPTSATVHKGIRIITAGSHYGQMRFHCLSLALSQKTEMLRVAELLRYILRFHFTFMAGAWGLKMCLPPLSIIQANTQRQIYNSTTGELIQFIGAGVFLFFFSLALSLFPVSFLLSVESCCIYCLILTAKACTWHLDHPFFFYYTVV